MVAAVIDQPLTAQEIARQLGKPAWQILYVIRSRGIRPAARAGAVRLFTPAQRAYIRSELERIAAADRAAQPT